MKLIHYTNRNLFILLFFLIGGWGFFFYLTIIDEVTDETDDRLENSRDILVSKALFNPEILTTEDIMQTYIFRPLTVEEAKDYEEKFYDSTLYIESEDEYEPVRVMKSCFRASDDNFYELEIRISTMERDDMIEAILWYLLVLYFLLLLCTVIGTRVVLKKTFGPLHKLLVWLDTIIPGKPVPPLDNETEITEFRKLNEAAFAMSRRSELAYEEQKQFIENASHELQTPLAISLGKLELLAESDGMGEKQLSDIDDLYQTLGRAVKLNKSLLLLSRIRNNQYQQVEELNLNAIIHKLIPDLMEVYEHKDILLSIEEPVPCLVHMNESLAHILVSNLLKNAIIHNEKGGELKIITNARSLTIINSGDHPLDDGYVFRRFYRSESSDNKESTGLGLAIVKSIADLYNIEISYNYKNSHIFILKFVK